MLRISTRTVNSGCSRSTRPPADRLDAATQIAFDLRRGHRKPLVGSLSGDPETLDLQVGKGAQHRIRDSVDIAPGPHRPGEVGDSGQPRQAFTHPDPIVGRFVLELDPAHQRADLGNTEVDRRGPDVVDKTLDKPGPVPSLERDLLVVNDDRLHSSVDRTR